MPLSAKQKMARLQKKPLIAFEMNRPGVLRFDDLASAAECFKARGLDSTVNAAKSNICASLKGRNYVAMGYVWRYDWERVSRRNRTKRDHDNA